MSKLNEKQQAALSAAVQLLKTEEDELMDPEDCGQSDCAGCETRHAVARLIHSDPDFLLRTLQAEQSRFDAFNDRLRKLEEERDEVFARKDALDAEVAAAWDELGEVLRRGPIVLN